MASLGDLIIRVGGNIDGFRQAMQEGFDLAEETAGKIEDRLSAIGDIGSRMVQVGAGLTAAITAPLVALGTTAVTTAAQFETTRIAFTTLMGSADAANAELAKLYNFAATTPFQVQGVLQGTRTLLAMQFAAKDVVPVLRVVGDAASGLGLGQEGLERLLFHFGQIKAEGAIDGRVIRELGMAGINAGQMLADSLGKTVPEVMDMVHKKAIGATVAINALLAGMSRDFGGLMQSQMAGFEGMLSNLWDNIKLSMAALGNVMLPLGKQIVQFLTDVTFHVKEAAQWFAGLPAPVQAAVGAFLGIVALAGPVMVFIGGLAFALPPVIALFGGLTAALGISGVALAASTAGLSLLIPALIALGVWVSEHTEGVKAFFVDLGQHSPEIKILTHAVELLWEGLTKLGAWVSGQGGSVTRFFGFMAEQVPGLSAAVAIFKALADSSPVKAFEAADSAAQKSKASIDAIAAATKTLRLGTDTGAPVLTDPKVAWAEKHRLAVEEARKAVAVLSEANKTGAVSADTLAAAQKRLASILAQKMPDFTERGPKESDKLSDPEKARAKEIDGELAHNKALSALQADAVAFKLKMGQISEAQSIQQLNDIGAREIEAEQKALEAKKAIYKNNLTEHQQADNQLAALVDKNALQMQQAQERIDLHDKSLADKAAKRAEEWNNKMEGIILEGEQVAEKITAIQRDRDTKLAEIGIKSSAAGEEGAGEFKKLELDRQFQLSGNNTPQARIAFQQKALAIEKEIARVKIDALTAEQATETDPVKKAELGLRLQQEIIRAAEKEYTAETRITEEKRKQTTAFQVQQAAQRVPAALGGALSAGIFNGKNIGQDIANSLKGIGQQLLGNIFTRLITTTLTHIAATIGLTAATTANTGVTTLHAGTMLTHAGVMLTHMAAVVFNTIATIANTLWTAILSAVETVKAFFGFAGGGDPPVGIPSIIGERGPELFIPKEAGTIIPNHMLNFKPQGAAGSVSSSTSTSNSGGNTFHFHGVQNVRDMMRSIASVAKTASPKFSPFAT